MRSSKEKLLKDVVAEGDYAGFRQRVLHETSGEFRKYHGKRGGKVWLALAAMIAFGAFIWIQLFATREKTIVAETPKPRMNAVQSALGVEIVETKPIPDSDVIRTVPSQSLVVRTKVTLPEISDAQLLAMLKTRGAGFVRNDRGRHLVIMGAKETAPSEREKTLQ